MLEIDTAEAGDAEELKLDDTTVKLVVTDVLPALEVTDEDDRAKDDNVKTVELVDVEAVEIVADTDELVLLGETEEID